MLFTVTGCGSNNLGSRINYDYTLSPEASLVQALQDYTKALRDDDWETVNYFDANTYLLSPEETEIFYQTTELPFIESVEPDSITVDALATQFQGSASNPFGTVIQGNGSITMNRSALPSNISGGWAGIAQGQMQLANGERVPYRATVQKMYGSEEWKLSNLTIYSPTETTNCELTDANQQQGHRVGLCNIRIAGKQSAHIGPTRVVDVDYAYTGEAEVICLQIAYPSSSQSRQIFPAMETYVQRSHPHYPCIKAQPSGTITILTYGDPSERKFHLQFSELTGTPRHWFEWIGGESGEQLDLQPIHIIEDATLSSQ